MDRSKASQYGKNIMDSRWVFKRKNEPNRWIRYKSCIVSKGFQQITGIDYTKRFTPISADSTMRLIFILSLWFKELTCESIGIEAAFLKGSNEEPTFMEWPPHPVNLG